MFKKIQTSLVEYSCNRTLEVPTTDNVIGKIVPFKSTPGSVPSQPLRKIIVRRFFYCASL